MIIKSALRILQIVHLLWVSVLLGQNFSDAEDFGCPNGSHRLDNFCYSISSLKTHFELSKLSCKAHGGELAMVKNANIHMFLQKLRLKNHMSYWIGLNDKIEEGHWLHSDGSAVEKFSHWAPGHPDEHENHHCAIMKTDGNFLWYGTNCDVPYYYVCQFEGSNCMHRTRPSLGPHCFEFSNKIATYTDAELQCKASGGYLAKINESTLHEFVTDLIINDKKWMDVEVEDITLLGRADLPTVWIGVRYYRGQWVYMDGSPATYALWQIGEPDNRNRNDECVATREAWYDAACSDRYHFACQYKVAPAEFNLSNSGLTISKIDGEKIQINIWNLLRNN